MVLCLSGPEQMQNIVFPDCGRMKSRGEEVSGAADMSCIQFPCGRWGFVSHSIQTKHKPARWSINLAYAMLPYTYGPPKWLI